MPIAQSSLRTTPIRSPILPETVVLQRPPHDVVHLAARLERNELEAEVRLRRFRFDDGRRSVGILQLNLPRIGTECRGDRRQERVVGLAALMQAQQRRRPARRTILLPGLPGYERGNEPFIVDANIGVPSLQQRDGTSARGETHANAETVITVATAICRRAVEATAGSMDGIPVRVKMVAAAAFPWRISEGKRPTR